MIENLNNNNDEAVNSTYQGAINANTDNTDKSGGDQDIPAQPGQGVKETNGMMTGVKHDQVPDPCVTWFRRDKVVMGNRGPGDKSGGGQVVPAKPGQVTETNGVACVMLDQVPDPRVKLFRPDQVKLGHIVPAGPGDKSDGGQDKPAQPGQGFSQTNDQVKLRHSPGDESVGGQDKPAQVGLDVSETIAAVARVKLDQVPDPRVKLFRRDQVELGYRGPAGPGSGMFNMGNTCYLNSTLQVVIFIYVASECFTLYFQALFHVHALVNYLKHGGHENNCGSNGFSSCTICIMAATLRGIMIIM